MTKRCFVSCPHLNLPKNTGDDPVCASVEATSSNSPINNILHIIDIETPDPVPRSGRSGSICDARSPQCLTASHTEPPLLQNFGIWLFLPVLTHCCLPRLVAGRGALSKALPRTGARMSTSYADMGFTAAPVAANPVAAVNAALLICWYML